jgi:predicted HicB family RNase H-like nuclease
MAQTPLRNFRVPEDQWRRWEAEAIRRNISISEFIRQAVNQVVTPALPALEAERDG